MPEPSSWRSLGMLATVGMTFVVATAGAALIALTRYVREAWLEYSFARRPGYNWPWERARGAREKKRGQQ